MMIKNNSRSTIIIASTTHCGRQAVSASPRLRISASPRGALLVLLCIMGGGRPLRAGPAPPYSKGRGGEGGNRLLLLGWCARLLPPTPQQHAVRCS